MAVVGKGLEISAQAAAALSEAEREAVTQKNEIAFSDNWKLHIREGDFRRGKDTSKYISQVVKACGEKNRRFCNVAQLGELKKRFDPKLEKLTVDNEGNFIISTRQRIGIKYSDGAEGSVVTVIKPDGSYADNRRAWENAEYDWLVKTGHGFQDFEQIKRFVERGEGKYSVTVGLLNGKYVRISYNTQFKFVKIDGIDENEDWTEEFEHKVLVFLNQLIEEGKLRVKDIAGGEGSNGYGLVQKETPMGYKFWSLSTIPEFVLKERGGRAFMSGWDWRRESLGTGFMKNSIGD